MLLMTVTLRNDDDGDADDCDGNDVDDDVKTLCVVRISAHPQC